MLKADTIGRKTCLDCVNWASRWDTVPRRDGCQIWEQLASLPKGGGSGSVPSGSASVQDGLVCPRFALYVPSPKDDLSPSQLGQLSVMQGDVRTLYASLCKLERSVAKLASFQGVDDEGLCQEVRIPARELQRCFRPLKTDISSFDDVLSKSSGWTEYVSAFLARKRSDEAAHASEEGADADASAGERSLTASEFLDSECLAERAEISGDECLDAFGLRFSELQSRFAQVEERERVIARRAEELPSVMAERQEAARKKRLEGLQEDYDWEFKEAMIRYRGLNQRLLHLRFFERSKREELLEQKKRQVRRLEKINEKYAAEGVVLNDLEELGVSVDG